MTLTYDSSIVGMSLDQVCAVRIGDRAVVVPFAPEHAVRAGFTLVEVPDEQLLAAGVAPRRGPRRAGDEPVDATSTVAPIVPASVSGDAALDAVIEAVSRHAEPSGSVTAAAVSAPSVGGGQGEWPAVGAERRTGVRGRRASDRAAVSAAPPAPSIVVLPVSPSTTPEDVARVLGSVPGLTADGLRAAVSALVGMPGAGAVADLCLRAPVALPSADRAISARGLRVVRDRVALLDAVDLSCDEGELVLVRGDEVATKTLLRVLAGIEPVSGGRVRVGTEDLAIATDEVRAVRTALGAGYASAGSVLVPDLSVVENVELPLLGRGDAGTVARALALGELAASGLDAWGAVAVSAVPPPVARRLVLARALVTAPTVVCVDDLTVGLPPVDAHAVLRRLELAGRLGTTVLLRCSDERVSTQGVAVVSVVDGHLVREPVVG